MKSLIFIICFLFSASAFAEITLTITKKDGSNYWTQYFNTRAQGDTWLANEKLQPYWVSSYVATFTGTDNVIKPVPTPDPAKVSAQAARVIQIQSALTNWSTLTAAQKDAAMKAALTQLVN